MRKLFTICWLVGAATAVQAQSNDNARITGNLQTNANFFIRDSAIGAANTPQYDNQKFGAESWLNLNYSNWGFDVGVRFDLFNNSNLLNPTSSYSDEGIGRWFVKKSIGPLDVEGGYLYDQIGSGIIFRAYEERALMIDNALYGVKAAWNIDENWRVRGFTGRMKQQFDTYGAVIRGGAVDGFIRPDTAGKITLAPGFGVVARTYSDQTMEDIVNTIATYTPQDSIGAQYNTYAFSLYNTLSMGAFTWFIEGAYKTKDVMFDPFEPTADGGTGQLVNREGYTIYTSLSYGAPKIGVTVEAKRTDDFSFRNTPFLTNNPVQGPINFLPPIARQNTFRLPARFAPATQELGEQGVQVDLRYKPSKKWEIGLNVSDVQRLNGDELYREIAPEVTYKKDRKWQLLLGMQFLHYNMSVYQGKTDPEDPEDVIPWVGTGEQDYVDAYTPYAEWLYKFTPKKSLRLEAQYLLTDDEFGSWINALAEVGLAPHWLFYVSDMYKIKKGEDTNADPRYDGLHYPSLGVVYTLKATRVSFAYVKQVEGINCAGGICRLEPTFSGFRLNLNTSF
ncbi:MAG: DUF6029 family protein [Saprospiraceae bacterium]|nr:DUF6029 family protein [Saprospiraceae bacterium]